MTWLEPNFPGRVGRTVADSKPAWRRPRTLHARSAPNVLVVILDDTGWSDFGCFGSSIRTPTIDRLATRGLRYTNFHTTPLCSPTRACFLTGRNHHSVGMRFLADTDTGFPNSRGHVHFDVPMLPNMLRDAGYGTYLCGKWHLAPLHEVTPAGPFRNWPLARGFDRFYGFLDGCTDQYAPELFEDNHQVEIGARENYHLTEDIVEHAISYVTNHRSFRPEAPFYLQVALGATHAPFQVPRGYIDPYISEFTHGWDEERLRRLRRQISLGLLPEGTRLTRSDDQVAPWNTLNDAEQRLYKHLQAAFAGFLQHSDEQLGKLLAALERLGVLDDTIVLVMSDNGASREGGQHGAVDCNGPYSGNPQSVAQQLQQLDTLGGPDGPAHYPQGWAMAGNTPYRLYKQYVDLGGVRSPLVVSWPNGIGRGGEIRDSFVHVIDLMPTILELAGMPKAATDGASIAATFDDPSKDAGRDTQYWEMLGHRAIWHRGWKAVTAHEPGTPYESDVWRLYDTSKDRSEATDLAAEHPDTLRMMQELWWQEAERHHVMPLDDRPLSNLLRLRSPLGLSARRRIVLPSGVRHIPLCSGLTGTARSMRLTVSLQGRGPGDEGVLIASGSSQGGYSFYIKDGRAHFEHRALGQAMHCASDAQVPIGDVELAIELRRNQDRSAVVEMYVNQASVAAGHVPFTSAHLSFRGADIGRDAVSQVSSRYQGEFPFPTGVLEAVTIEFHDPPPIAEIAEALVHIE